MQGFGISCVLYIGGGITKGYRVIGISGKENGKSLVIARLTKSAEAIPIKLLRERENK